MKDFEYAPILRNNASSYLRVDESQLYSDDENFIVLYDNYGYELMKVQSVIFRQDNKYAYKTIDGEYGIIDEYGFILLNPQKYEIARIKENFILLKEVVEDYSWGEICNLQIIDYQGNVIIPFFKAHLSLNMDVTLLDHCAVFGSFDNACGSVAFMVNKNGERIYDNNWENSVIKVCKNFISVKFGDQGEIVDFFGKKICSGYIISELNGRYVVGNSEIVALLSETGKIILPLRYKYIRLREDGGIDAGYCHWLDQCDDYGNLRKEIIDVTLNSSGILYVEEEGKRRYFDKNVVCIGKLENGLRFIYDGYWGALDENWQQIIPCKYSNILWIEERFLEVAIDGYGVIDTKGNIIVPLNDDYFDIVFYSKQNIFKCGQSGTKKTDFYSHEGFLIASVPYDFYSCWGYSEGLIIINNGELGYVDKNGKIIIPFIYDWCYPCKNGICKARKGNKMYSISREGEILSIQDVEMEETNSYRGFSDDWDIKSEMDYIRGNGGDWIDD